MRAWRIAFSAGSGKIGTRHFGPKRVLAGAVESRPSLEEDPEAALGLPSLSETVRFYWHFG
jgi:hypothetical protein